MRQQSYPGKSNGFENLFAREKSPQVSVLEAESFQRRDDSIIFHKFFNPPAERVIFSKILANLSLKPGYLKVMELKNPGIALVGSGVPEARRGLYPHTTSECGGTPAAC
jgi:hypothetical protein